MGKVVVYVREDDVRAIERVEQKEIAEWVKAAVKEKIEEWKEERTEAFRQGQL